MADITACPAAIDTTVCDVCGKPPEPDNRLKGGAHIRYCYQWRRRNDPTRPKCTTSDCGRPARAGKSALCDRCYQRAQRGNAPAARPFHQRNKGETCKVEWCTGEARKKGWCEDCYGWSWNNGGADPTARRYRYNRTVQDVVALVLSIEPDPITGCRDATGVFSTDAWGYPVASVAGKASTRITRLVVEHNLGRPMMRATHACHTCDNPPCVEPTHLWEGTPAQNSHDRDTKGRGARGVTHGRSRLDPDKVRAIRARYVPGTNQHDSNVAALAREVGVKPQAIRDVVRRRTWAHIE
ncbi:hypothetical protein AB0N14_17955 [Streptomyces sp. NPDC051104]|uniref:hypothetical protein n=1 Tax=Streptomyces sp. NPDC051104 TaxID=3155044 RepID=UPI00342925AF